jgi:hypothetical protein
MSANGLWPTSALTGPQWIVCVPRHSCTWRISPFGRLLALCILRRSVCRKKRLYRRSWGHQGSETPECRFHRDERPSLTETCSGHRAPDSKAVKNNRISRLGPNPLFHFSHAKAFAKEGQTKWGKVAERQRCGGRRLRPAQKTGSAHQSRSRNARQGAELNSTWRRSLSGAAKVLPQLCKSLSTQVGGFARSSS